MSNQRLDELRGAAVAGPVTVGTMFGSQGLRTGMKLFGVWWHEQLVVKLPHSRIDELVAAGDAEPFDPCRGGR